MVEKWIFGNKNTCHSVRIIGVVSHTNYVVCVIFIYKRLDLQFKVDSERKIFLIYSQSFWQKSTERKSPKKYFFVFCCDVWPGARTLTLHLISQRTIY